MDKMEFLNSSRNIMQRSKTKRVRTELISGQQQGRSTCVHKVEPVDRLVNRCAQTYWPKVTITRFSVFWWLQNIL